MFLKLQRKTDAMNCPLFTEVYKFLRLCFSLRDGDNLPVSNTKLLLVTYIQTQRKEIRLALGGLSRLVVF